MIEELVAYISFVDKDQLRSHAPKNALSRSRYKIGDISGRARVCTKNRTFTVGPQERTRRLPIVIGGTSKEPSRGPSVMGDTCGVVVKRRIRGGKPSSNLFLEFGT